MTAGAPQVPSALAIYSAVNSESTDALSGDFKQSWAEIAN